MSDTLAAAAALAAILSTLPPARAAEPLSDEQLCRVGSAKQVFIDDRFFDSADGVELTMNPPRKTGERLIVSDRPWESFLVNAYVTVMEDGGRYRLWYEGYTKDQPGDLHARLCYAESRDGIHWVKPELGVYDYEGSTANNIVFDGRPGPGYHGGTVFKDPTARRAERYKLFYLRGGAVGGAFSPDGIHWQEYEGNPILELSSDTQNVCWWDHGLRKYVGFVRTWTPMRTIGRSETSDFVHWPPAEVVCGYDERDPADTDLYNSACVRYPYAANAYLIFTSVFNHPSDTLHVQLATSRDSAVWRRDFREPFIALGQPGEFDSACVYASVGLLRKGDELWMYYTGYDKGHDQRKPNVQERAGVISRAVLRLDGYVSVDAGPETGGFTTKGLSFAGRELYLNVQTARDGWVRVAVLDEAGQRHRWYSLRECQPIRGDGTAKRVVWRYQDDLGPLLGTRVRLRFEMRKAKLYAFQFRD